ncbi:MAG TPA: TnsD family Tn7-like transposition protein [Allosphingosinicella sp.]|jgi:hypothetical protein
MFPVPLSGELLYGVLGRHRYLAGSPNAAQHATDLFGRRHAVATFDLPGHLDALAARLPKSTGLDGRGLLSHTLFPFYAAFQPRDVRSTVEGELRGDTMSSAHHRLGVAAFRIRAGGTLRFCQDCMDAQLAEHGQASWFVVHQVPGVMVCPEHGGWLLDSLVSQATASRHDYVLPSADNCPRTPASPFSGEAPPLLRDLARAAAELCETGRPARDLKDWRPHYLATVEQAGLMRSRHKVDQVRLNSRLEEFWHRALPFLPAPCAVLGETGWAAAMVREHRKAMHPLLHLMFEIFLSGEIGAAGAPIMSHRSVERRSAPADAAIRPARAARGASPHARSTRLDWPQIDEACCGQLVAEAIRIRDLEPPVRVTSSELERRVMSLGWFGKRRDKLPASIALLKRLHERVESFQRRRATYWARRLGPSVRAWEVMRAAGVRSGALPMIRQVLAESCKAP